MHARIGILAVSIQIAGTVLFPVAESLADARYSDDTMERKSFHFIIRYHQEVTPSFLNRLVDQAEDCYNSISRDFHFFRDDPWVWDNRAVIYVYKDRDAYLKATGMPEWSWAAAKPHQKEVHTFNGAWEVFRYALVHELTHLIFREYIGMYSDVPLCFDEGAAVYMERRNERDAIARQVRSILKSDDRISLRELLQTGFSDLQTDVRSASGLSGQDYVKAFYLESFGLINFLLEKYDRFKFSTFARKMRDGLSFENAFFQAYRLLRTWDDVEKEWLRFYEK